jgi:hypothetical protein
MSRVRARHSLVHISFTLLDLAQGLEDDFIQ